MSNGETNREGVREIEIDPRAADFYAVVAPKGKTIYIPHIEVRNRIVSAISDSIILYRPVASRGEILRVKG